MTRHAFTSVIMPVLNQVRFLPAALDSVLTQDYPALELVVADGGSTDGTIEILQAASARDARLRWVSQPDTGPSQALNRAIARIRGTIIGWLNADDLYVPGTVRRTVEIFSQRPDWIMVYGQGEYIDENGDFISRYPTLEPPGPLGRFADSCFVCQPSVFFRRTMPMLLGPLDESLTASFDFDYWIRAFQAFPDRIGFIDQIQAQSRLHSGGITARQRQAVMMEGMRIVAGALGTAPSHWMTTYMEELMAGDPSKRPDNLRAHFLETLTSVARYMDGQDVVELRRAIEDDMRLEFFTF